MAHHSVSTVIAWRQTPHANHVVSGKFHLQRDSSCHEYAHPGVPTLIMALLLTISYHVCLCTHVMWYHASGDPMRMIALLFHLHHWLLYLSYNQNASKCQNEDTSVCLTMSWVISPKYHSSNIISPLQLSLIRIWFFTHPSLFYAVFNLYSRMFHKVQHPILGMWHVANHPNGNQWSERKKYDRQQRPWECIRIMINGTIKQSWIINPE